MQIMIKFTNFKKFCEFVGELAVKERNNDALIKSNRERVRHCNPSFHDMNDGFMARWDIHDDAVNINDLQRDLLWLFDDLRIFNSVTMERRIDEEKPFHKNELFRDETEQYLKWL